jgi:hypothetical protein
MALPWNSKNPIKTRKKGKKSTSLKFPAPNASPPTPDVMAKHLP